LLPDYILLEDFLEALQENLPGFSEQPKHIQRHLANLIWETDTKYRQHKKYQGTSIHYKELYKMFGRNGFTPINKKLKIFNISTHWLPGKYTKAYKLTNKAEKIKTDYLNSDNKKPSRIIKSNGNYMIHPPRAIASKDKDNKDANKWRNTNFSPWVPVNIKELKGVKARMQVFINAIGFSGIYNKNNPKLVAYRDKYFRYINEINKILKLAHNDIREGYVIHKYRQCSTGRVFVGGTNTQTAPQIVKMAALHGLWEYDIENCHYAIFKQLAEKIGIECPTINRYLEHKKEFRHAIKTDVNISLDATKKCLLALIYGANSFEWHDADIPKLIGLRKSKELIKHTLYSAIHKEVRTVRPLILKHQDAKRGRYMNAMGTTIQTHIKTKTGIRKTPAKEILAHLIQGVEAKMLNTVYHKYPKNIVLLQHDGFASTSKLNTKTIERLLKKETGFDVGIDEWQIETKAKEREQWRESIFY